MRNLGKSTIILCDFLLMVMANNNRGRITYRLRDIAYIEVENRHFRPQYSD